MEISNYVKNNITFMTVIGQLWQKEDITALEENVNVCLREHRKYVVIDMQRLSFINSQGLGVLVRMHANMSEVGSKLVLFCTPSSVLDVLEISGLDSFMTIVKSVQELQFVIGKFA